MFDDCAHCGWLQTAPAGATDQPARCQLHQLSIWQPTNFCCANVVAARPGRAPRQRGPLAHELEACIVLLHPGYPDVADGEERVPIGTIDEVRDWSASQQRQAWETAYAAANARHTAAAEARQQERVKRTIERRTGKRPPE